MINNDRLRALMGVRRGNTSFGSAHNVLSKFPGPVHNNPATIQPRGWATHPMLRRFVDTDRDGVPDHLDCKPFDRRKQMAFKTKADTPLIDYPKDFGFVSKRVVMTPQAFLKRVGFQYENSGSDYRDGPGNNAKQYHKEIRDYVVGSDTGRKLMAAVASKEKVVASPWIEYNEGGVPGGHEGRHRAFAAIEVGVKKIPVIMVARKREDIPTIKQLQGIADRAQKERQGREFLSLSNEAGSYLRRASDDDAWKDLVKRNDEISKKNDVILADVAKRKREGTW